jgi:hypothetical protein
MVLKVSKVLQDQQVLMGQLEQQDHKVLQDQQVLMVTMELQVQLVHRVLLDQLEQTETMELQDHKVLLVLLVHKGLLEILVLQVILDHKDRKVPLEPQVLLVHRVRVSLEVALVQSRYQLVQQHKDLVDKFTAHLDTTQNYMKVSSGVLQKISGFQLITSPHLMLNG